MMWKRCTTKLLKPTLRSEIQRSVSGSSSVNFEKLAFDRKLVCALDRPLHKVTCTLEHNFEKEKTPGLIVQGKLMCKNLAQSKLGLLSGFYFSVM